MPRRTPPLLAPPCRDCGQDISRPHPLGAHLPGCELAPSAAAVAVFIPVALPAVRRAVSGYKSYTAAGIVEIGAGVLVPCSHCGGRHRGGVRSVSCASRHGGAQGQGAGTTGGFIPVRPPRTAA